jgi:hypothetical protein
MAVQTADGDGISGADVDALAPVPRGVLPMSYLLAAYVDSGSTPGAQALRQLMGKQDWHHPQQIVFPTLALALLASDIARSLQSGTQLTAANGPGGLAAPLAAAVRQDLASNPCSTVDQWVNDTFNFLYDAIHKGTAALFGQFVAFLVGVGLRLAAGAVTGLLTVLAAPVISAIRAGVSLLALAFEAITVLTPWSLRLANAPQPNTYSDRPGSVTLSVLDTGSINWPKPLQDCVMQITHQDLPQLHGATGNPVAWKVEQAADTSQQEPLVAVDGTTAARQTSLGTATTTAHTAALDYVTSSENACPGATPVTTSYVISAEVTRLDAETIQRLVPQFLGGLIAQIPDILRGAFTSAIATITADVTQKLQELTGHDRATGLLLIEHHDLDLCTGPNSGPPNGTPSTTPPPPPVLDSCSRVPQLGAKLYGHFAVLPAGFSALTCYYYDAGGQPVGFIIVETFRSPAAARAFFAANITGQPHPGFTVPVRIGELCRGDQELGLVCDRDEFALNGYRIDEVEQSAERITRPMPAVGVTDAVMRELIAIT